MAAPNNTADAVPVTAALEQLLDGLASANSTTADQIELPTTSSASSLSVIPHNTSLDTSVIQANGENLDNMPDPGTTSSEKFALDKDEVTASTSPSASADQATQLPTSAIHPSDSVSPASATNFNHIMPNNTVNSYKESASNEDKKTTLAAAPTSASASNIQATQAPASAIDMLGNGDTASGHMNTPQAFATSSKHIMPDSVATSDEELAGNKDNITTLPSTPASASALTGQVTQLPTSAVRLPNNIDPAANHVNTSHVLVTNSDDIMSDNVDKADFLKSISHDTSAILPTISSSENEAALRHAYDHSNAPAAPATALQNITSEKGDQTHATAHLVTTPVRQYPDDVYAAMEAADMTSFDQALTRNTIMTDVAMTDRPALPTVSNVEAEFQMDTSPYVTDSDSESDSSSDDDDQDPYKLLSPEEQARILMDEVGSDDERGQSHGKGKAAAVVASSQPRTKNEVVAKPPPLPKVLITEDMGITELGNVRSIVEGSVLIEGKTSSERKVLDAGSIVCTSDKKLVGTISELLGKVYEPIYVAQLPESYVDEHGRDQTPNLSPGQTLYYPQNLAVWVFTDHLHAEKGTDASNIFDEEAGAHEQEDSGDEVQQGDQHEGSVGGRGGQRGRGGRGGRGNRGDRGGRGGHGRGNVAAAHQNVPNRRFNNMPNSNVDRQLQPQAELNYDDGDYVRNIRPVAHMGNMPSQVGHPQQQTGYPQPQMGYPQPQMGYPQPQMGYQQPQMGYPQPPMNYMPPYMGHVPGGTGYSVHQQFGNSAGRGFLAGQPGSFPAYGPYQYPPMPPPHMPGQAVPLPPRNMGNAATGSNGSVWNNTHGGDNAGHGDTQ